MLREFVALLGVEALICDDLEIIVEDWSKSFLLVPLEKTAELGCQLLHGEFLNVRDTLFDNSFILDTCKLVPDFHFLFFIWHSCFTSQFCGHCSIRFVITEKLLDH